jgi:primosomal protein N'
LKYPPFAEIFKLVCQDYSRAIVDKEADALYAKLEDLKDKKIKFSAPQYPMVNKVRGQFRKQLILKITEDGMPKELTMLLTGLGRGWSIDRDPISIA